MTSSNSTIGGVCTGLGISPDKINEVLGITKAYTTRVGGGPFPTETRGEIGAFLQEKGNEFGATTGRPRRCGWFDAFAVAYARRLNGIKHLALTKPDVLDGLEELSVCVGYKYKGQLLRGYPCESWILSEVEPVYKKMSGWKETLNSAEDFQSFPQEFKDYVHLIEDLVGANVSIVSTGVERNDTVFREDLMKSFVDLEKVKNGVKF